MLLSAMWDGEVSDVQEDGERTGVDTYHKNRDRVKRKIKEYW